MKNRLSRFQKFFCANRAEILLLFFILALGGFLRLYRIADYMTFLGDEGRDALALKRMIVDHKFRLIGPVTSIGNMYLGPLYYYLVAPAMLLSGLSPVGPSVFVALLSVATIGLIWWAGREFFNREAGLIAALLYAVSPVVIIYSRSSWNPNVMPFFALLTLFGLWRIWQKHQFYYLPWLGIFLSFAVQSHYLGLLLFPTVGLFWLATLRSLWLKRLPRKKFLLSTLGLVFFFSLLTILPLVWFDLRHGGINSQAFKQFFTVRQATVNLKAYKGIPQLGELTEQIFTRLAAAKNETWGGPIALIVVLALVFKMFRPGLKSAKQFLTQNPALILLLIWFSVGLLGLANYKQHIYDHYFGFLFPLPFLLLGWLLSQAWHFKTSGKLLTLLSLIFFLLLAYQECPLRSPPNRQLARTRQVARFILQKAEGKPFNLALIAERNYEDAYAFFMEIWQTPPTLIEPLKADQTITGQLFVVCEKLPCQPINHPKAEIAMFGWSKIDQKWDLAGVEVYKLIHNR